MLSFAYVANLSLFIEMKYMHSSMLDLIGIGIGVVLLITSAFFLFCYAQADSFYTEFKEKFTSDGFGRRFYVIFILERVIMAAMMVMIAGQSLGNAAVIGIYLILGVVILVKQPYVGERKNYRPIANCLIVIVIEGVFLGAGMSKDPKGMLSLYGPLVILGLLLVCVIYSAYALGKELKEKFDKCRGKDEKESLESQKELAEQ